MIVCEKQACRFIIARMKVMGLTPDNPDSECYLDIAEDILKLCHASHVESFRRNYVNWCEGNRRNFLEDISLETKFVTRERTIAELIAYYLLIVHPEDYEARKAVVMEILRWMGFDIFGVLDELLTIRRVSPRSWDDINAEATAWEGKPDPKELFTIADIKSAERRLNGIEDEEDEDEE